MAATVIIISDCESGTESYIDSDDCCLTLSPQRPDPCVPKIETPLTPDRDMYIDNLPVFKHGRVEYTVPELVLILLGTSLNDDVVCKAQPIGIQQNCSFVVDLTCVKDPNDLRADDCGVWRHKGVRKTWVVTDEDGAVILQTRERAPPNTEADNQVYILTRVYHALQASPEFKRMIVTLTDASSQEAQTNYCRYALVQYKFDREEHAIEKPPHKNSKTSTPYKRTNPSTIKRLREVSKHNKPSSAFELVEEEMGGACLGNSGKLPRSKRQCTDIRKRLFVEHDELACIMEKCKCLKEGEAQFIRTVVAAPQPLCVLATDVQLKQLQLCCTDPNTFSIVSVDPTFNLGSFFVTPIVFLHKAFVTKRSHKSPVFLGPILIHQQMNTDAYGFFAHQLQVLLPSLSKIQAFGTDGELALVAGFQNAFPSALHLRCFKHFRDNCDVKLKELNLNDSARQEIIADIIIWSRVFYTNSTGFS